MSDPLFVNLIWPVMVALFVGGGGLWLARKL
jgi:hypothetical protein